MIQLIFILLAGVLFSGCTGNVLSDPNRNQPSSTPTAVVLPSDDQTLLREMESDTDLNFDAEFQQLESDLE